MFILPVYTFGDDGTWGAGGQYVGDYTYKTSGGKITLFYQGRVAGTADYAIRDAGKTLVISNGNAPGFTSGTYHRP